MSQRRGLKSQQLKSLQKRKVPSDIELPALLTTKKGDWLSYKATVLEEQRRWLGPKQLRLEGKLMLVSSKRNDLQEASSKPGEKISHTFCDHLQTRNMV